MHNAFSPIGLMIDFWDETIKKVETRVPVIIISDLEEEWKGIVIFRILKDDKVVLEKTQEITISSFGQNNCTFTSGNDLTEGKYTIEVSLVNTPFGTVKSIRNFRI